MRNTEARCHSNTFNAPDYRTVRRRLHEEQSWAALTQGGLA